MTRCETNKARQLTIKRSVGADNFREENKELKEKVKLYERLIEERKV